MTTLYPKCQEHSLAILLVAFHDYLIICMLQRKETTIKVLRKWKYPLILSELFKNYKLNRKIGKAHTHKSGQVAKKKERK